MVELTDNHKLLLSIGLSRGVVIGKNEDGTVKYKNAVLYSEDALQLYSNQDAAYSALITLRFKGFIDITEVPGRFKILVAPPECHMRADEMRKKKLTEQSSQPD